MLFIYRLPDDSDEWQRFVHNTQKTSTLDWFEKEINIDLDQSQSGVRNELQIGN
jgi:hypothetical protein